MIEFVQQTRADAIAFDVILLIAAIVAHRWLQRRHNRGFSPRVALAFVPLLIVAVVLPEVAGHRASMRMQRSMAGIAPTYAQELELAGHARLTLDTPPDDQAYLDMIAAQRRWVGVNPGIADVYTLRLTADGQPAFLVDAETDYDHNGKIEGDAEARTTIGEVYDEATPNMLLAFAGQATFDSAPVTDRWGTWVSAYVPMRDATGRVEGVLGVDYDATHWMSTIEVERLAAIGIVAALSAIVLGAAVIVTMTRAELEHRARAELERQEMHRKLLDVSRQAGMAEVATSVLHNVGNVLNSVNLSANLVNDNVSNSKVSALAKATAMMRDNRDDIAAFMTHDDRGRMLPEYLIKLSEVLMGEHRQIATELNALTRSVQHIKQIVAAQQSFAKHVEQIEEIDLVDLFNDAARMNLATLDRHDVIVDRNFAAVGVVHADRHKLIQILVNLISNAKNAVKGNALGDRRIELRIESTTTTADGIASVRLAVADNGMGIAAENLDRVFAHGFTTRKDGHGFGLHSAAIAAQQMKGTLSAQSAGPGLGATFTLEIPRTPPASVATEISAAAASAH